MFLPKFSMWIFCHNKNNWSKDFIIIEYFATIRIIGAKNSLYVSSCGFLNRLCLCKFYHSRDTDMAFCRRVDSLFWTNITRPRPFLYAPGICECSDTWSALIVWDKYHIAMDFTLYVRVMICVQRLKSQLIDLGQRSQ